MATIDDPSDSEDISVDQLQMAAAKDMLHAFVLGGTSDVALAAAAEEVVRESCRQEAKKLFQNADDSSKVENSLRKSRKQQHPKPWLVHSFFTSYDVLSRALEIPKSEPSDESESQNTLPIQFLDRSDCDDAIMRERDREAYDLLCQCVEIIDCFTANENIGISGEKSMAPSTNQRDSFPFEEVEDPNVLSHLRTIAKHGQFVAEGNCQITPITPMPVASNDDANRNPVIQMLALLSTSKSQALTGVQWDESTGATLSIAAATNRSEETTLSRPLRSRLLNICSSLAYLLGDALAAVRCLRIGESIPNL